MSFREITLLRRLFITNDQKHKGSIRFIVDLANVIRRYEWIWREGGQWARVTASCCILGRGFGPQTQLRTHTHAHIQLVMNKGSNLRLCCKSDNIPIIGRGRHNSEWQCMCALLFPLGSVVYHPHQQPCYLLQSSDLETSFFIAPYSFNWLSLRTLFLQLVSNDSGFPETR